MLNRKWNVFSALLLCASGALAQSSPDQKAWLIQQIGNEVNDRCKELVPGFVDMDELRPALSSRPIDTNAVCSCAVATAVRNNRLLKAMDSTRAVPKNEILVVQKQLNSYTLLVIMHSVFSCLSADMAASAERSPLPE